MECHICGEYADYVCTNGNCASKSLICDAHMRQLPPCSNPRCHFGVTCTKCWPIRKRKKCAECGRLVCRKQSDKCYVCRGLLCTPEEDQVDQLCGTTCDQCYISGCERHMKQHGDDVLCDSCVPEVCDCCRRKEKRNK